MYNIKNLDTKLIEPLKILANRYNFKLDDAGRTIIATKTDENILKINATEDSIDIVYKDMPAFFRAIMIVDKNEKKVKKHLIYQQIFGLTLMV